MGNYTHFSLSERYQINYFSCQKMSCRKIANKLNRHPSSIAREIKRNKQDGLYNAPVAQQLAKKRSPGRKNKLETNPELKKYVVEKLEETLSPEQISGRMRFEGKTFYVCHETIYKHIYKNKDHGLYKLLTKKRGRRRLRSQRHTHEKVNPMNLKNIKHRPQEAASRDISGHWEGDTIRFPNDQKTCVTTLVERKSRFVTLRKNADGKTHTVIGHICDLIKASPKNTWKTITFDQGTEFTAFHVIARQTKCKTYFCDPHSPWQRPSNENINGRLRRFLPKKFQIDSIGQPELDIIANQLNNTPRKCLGYRTPKEVLMQYSKERCRT